MSAPTKPQIAQVRAILYKPSIVRQISDDLSSINVLLGVSPSTPSGSGPVWVIPDTGKAGSSITEAVTRAHRTASTLRQMAHQISSLSIPAADRTNLVRFLDSRASAWTARADVWAQVTPLSSDKIKSILSTIGGYESVAVAAAKKVSAYLTGNGP
jgi:hypothetical protein